MDLGRIFRVVPGFVVPVNVGATETRPLALVDGLVGSWARGSRVGLLGCYYCMILL